MTTSSGSTRFNGMDAVVTAVQELREAKQFLREGHLIKGVQRHERAKRELYRVSRALGQGGRTQVQPLAAAVPVHLPFHAFLNALEAYQNAYAGRRVDTSDSRATRALIEAEKRVIGELVQLEGALN